MAIFKRCKRLVQTSWDALVQPAADPRAAASENQKPPGDMLTQVDATILEIQTAHKQLLDRKDLLTNQLPKIMESAHQAVQNQRDDLARLALQRHQQTQHEIKILIEQSAATEREIERLQQVKQQLAAQIEAFQARQQVLNAQYSAAAAQVRLKESLSGISETFSEFDLSLDDIQQQADYMQARATAMNDLLTIGVLEIPQLHESDPTITTIDQVDNDKTIEAQLTALKREIQPGS